VAAGFSLRLHRRDAGATKKADTAIFSFQYSAFDIKLVSILR
jgi:hypothetical protein